MTDEQIAAALNNATKERIIKTWSAYGSNPHRRWHIRPHTAPSRTYDHGGITKYVGLLHEAQAIPEKKGG